MTIFEVLFGATLRSGVSFGECTRLSATHCTSFGLQRYADNKSRQQLSKQ